jgi:hypothetical protein
LLKNVQNLNFENYGINYNYEDSWELKLNNLFDFFKEPMIIKKLIFVKKKICLDHITSLIKLI